MNESHSRGVSDVLKPEAEVVLIRRRTRPGQERGYAREELSSIHGSLTNPFLIAKTTNSAVR